ncbi:MAG: hypothetical protein ABI557_18060, partial [Aureliella sp.]
FAPRLGISIWEFLGYLTYPINSGWPQVQISDLFLPLFRPALALLNRQHDKNSVPANRLFLG